MATEDDLDLDTDGEQEPSPKSKSKLILISLIVVVALGASGTAALMLSGILEDDGTELASDESTEVAAGKPAPASAKKARTPKAPLNYVPLDPPFVVNFGADSDIRFLQVSVQVGTRDPEAVDLVKEHRPAIRNNLVMLFSSQDPYQLNEREGKEKLREETLVEVQNVLKRETGKSRVESVFFTSFVMQ